MKQLYFTVLLALYSCSGFSQEMQIAWHDGIGHADEPASPIVFRRAQEPLAPYPYRVEEVAFINAYDHTTLAGSFTFPEQEGKYPAVILLTGSGAQNRDEEIMHHKPFKVIADYLTKRGIPVLRYDDRGTGQSTGQFDNSTIGDFSKDALAALDFLKQQKQVDKQKIGFIGHSEGGLIATLLAGQQVHDLSFIISLGGPAIAIDQLMVEQLYAIGKASGMGESALQAARKINEKNFSLVKGDLNSQEAYRGLLENMRMIPGSRSNMDVLAMVSPAYRYFMRIEPEKYLKNIQIPFFAAYGSLDLQVPATSNLESLYRLLPKNSKSVLKEYDGLNHLFQQATTGKVEEYVQIEETFNQQVLTDMADWINKL